jgi:3D (Asp-Asp-Asp) domain-containing protein
MSADKAVQIRGMLKRKQTNLKHQKRFKIICTITIIMAFCALYIFTYAKETVSTYNVKTANLSQTIKEVEMAQKDVEDAQKDIDEQKKKIEEDQEELLTTSELLAKNNQSIIEENIRLQDTLKKAASVGIKPQNYNDAEEVENAVDYSKLEYIGEFEGTAYTPSPEECSNNLGYTASGKPIVAGVSIAVDTQYWKLGTKFYIEGLGYVIAMDTGSAVKGKYRFDYAVFDKKFALKLGRQDWKVYKVVED